MNHTTLWNKFCNLWTQQTTREILKIPPKFANAHTMQTLFLETALHRRNEGNPGLGSLLLQIISRKSSKTWGWLVTVETGLPSPPPSLGGCTSCHFGSCLRAKGVGAVSRGNRQMREEREKTTKGTCWAGSHCGPRGSATFEEPCRPCLWRTGGWDISPAHGCGVPFQVHLPSHPGCRLSKLRRLQQKTWDRKTKAWNAWKLLVCKGTARCGWSWCGSQEAPGSDASETAETKRLRGRAGVEGMTAGREGKRVCPMPTPLLSVWTPSIVLQDHLTAPKPSNFWS